MCNGGEYSIESSITIGGLPDLSVTLFTRDGKPYPRLIITKESSHLSDLLLIEGEIEVGGYQTLDVKGQRGLRVV
jgi:hypothetical protein